MGWELLAEQSGVGRRPGAALGFCNLLPWQTCAGRSFQPETLGAVLSRQGQCGAVHERLDWPDFHRDDEFAGLGDADRMFDLSNPQTLFTVYDNDLPHSWYRVEWGASQPIPAVFTLNHHNYLIGHSGSLPARFVRW